MFWSITEVWFSNSSIITHFLNLIGFELNSNSNFDSFIFLSPKKVNVITSFSILNLIFELSSKLNFLFKNKFNGVLSKGRVISLLKFFILNSQPKTVRCYQ